MKENINGGMAMFIKGIVFLTILIILPFNMLLASNNSELIAAAFKGDTETVRLLLDKGANVNAKDEDGGTALMFASVNGHTDTVKMLLKRGANPNITAKSSSGTVSALIYAKRMGHEEIVNILKKAGAKR